MSWKFRSPVDRKPCGPFTTSDAIRRCRALRHFKVDGANNDVPLATSKLNTPPCPVSVPNWCGDRSGKTMVEARSLPIVPTSSSTWKRPTERSGLLSDRRNASFSSRHFWISATYAWSAAQPAPRPGPGGPSYAGLCTASQPDLERVAAIEGAHNLAIFAVRLNGLRGRSQRCGDLRIIRIPLGNSCQHSRFLSIRADSFGRVNHQNHTVPGERSGIQRGE